MHLWEEGHVFMCVCVNKVNSCGKRLRMFSCFNFIVDEFRGNTCCLLKPSGSLLESTMSIPLNLISDSRQSHLSRLPTPKIAHDLIILPAYVLLSYTLLIFHLHWSFLLVLFFLHGLEPVILGSFTTDVRRFLSLRAISVRGHTPSKCQLLYFVYHLRRAPAWGW